MYNDPKRYKTREYIRNEMIREVANLWNYDDSDVAIESFDPLVGMLLGAFATSIEGIHHELDNSRSRIIRRLAHLLTPDVLSGPQAAHAVMKVGIVDTSYTVSPQDIFTCNASGKEFHFTPAGQYTLYNCKLAAQIIQNRVKTLGSAPRENFLNEILPHNEVWVGINMDSGPEEFDRLPFFFDWRNDPARRSYLPLLGDVRMLTESGEELKIMPGLVNISPASGTADDFDPTAQAERMTQRFYNAHFLSISNTHRQTGQRIVLQKKKHPEELASLLNPEELQKIFLQELVWIKIRFPGGMAPDVLSRIVVDINAFPVLNRRALRPTFDLRPLFNVFPINVEESDFFFGIIDIETPMGIKLSNSRQFTRDSTNQYLLRQGGVARFDERDASEMISYLTDLLRDESAMFMALGRGSLETDIEEIRKHLERINKDLKKDSFPNWFVSVKTAEKSGRIVLNYWVTKADLANNIAFNTKLNRDRANKAFNDEMTVFLTTTQGGQRPLQGDEYLPVFRKALLTRGRIVTFEDYKAVCMSELGNQISEVNVKKGFGVGSAQDQGLQQTVDIYLTPNPLKPQSREQWGELKARLLNSLEDQSSGIFPIRIFVHGEQ
ncbi:type VI secretion system baseplate subunit TssF [Runella slithyformis]|uniref:Type VI secretion system baseplate subunit TssF n=1 Tax=Runella slithyformis (strain ATCC 29530 / DSM 19594 / LMG 11500 / NCIMB 11436 / LSU 4) TaxID=761193 RepID=A0A7U3ZQI1_RUNSL|nr:type VI secretion system baseplate subunit TssF [Runella slithyformis]AEI51520.1 hypothetical protein Runsl_5220 [Runella slithyformis DSM 19594]